MGYSLTVGQGNPRTLMTTRSGTTYKPTMSTEHTHDEELPARHAITSEEDASETLSLAELVRVMIEDREQRDREVAEEQERHEREIAEERRHHEEESERHRTEMRSHMDLLQRLVAERPTSASARTSGENEHVRLTRLSDDDDIEAYLTTFERMMEAYEVERARWSFKLAPQLTGKAQQAYAALPPEHAKDYDEVKAAILRRYNINEETYRQRFRSQKLKDGETLRELVTRLSDLVSRWTKDCSSVDDMKDLMVKEQLLAALPEDVRLWVTERKPKGSADARQLAEDYLQARSTENTKPAKQEEKTQERAPPGKCPRCGTAGHCASQCPNPRARRDATGSQQNSKPRYFEGVKCFSCNEQGHIATNCPKRSLYCDQAETRPRGQERVCRHRTINGIFCTDILVDTGATKTLVRNSWSQMRTFWMVRLQYTVHTETLYLTPSQ